MADRHRKTLTRRSFLTDMALAAAAAVLLRSTDLVERGWTDAAAGTASDAVRDTFNGLLAFILPGADEYSIAQGVSSAEPGAIDANVTEALIVNVDQSASYAPAFSAIVAAIFNDLAGLVNPSASGPFESRFAHLSFAEKAAVFQIMDSTDALKPLIGVLPAICAFLIYSEAGVFDPATRTISEKPVGWKLANYSGVADGRDEFRGYLRRRRPDDDDD